MPKRLFNVSLDLPGLPPMRDAEATQLAQLIEPLQPPQNATNLAWVIHNLRRALGELVNTAGCNSNKRLLSMQAFTESALQILACPPARPVITFDGEVTLWVCLLALSPADLDSRLHKLAGAVYVQLCSGGKPPSKAVMTSLLNAAMKSQRWQPGDDDAHIVAAQIACGRMLNNVLIQLRARAISHRSAASSMVEAKVEKAMEGAYRFDLKHQEDGSPRVRGLTARDVQETAQAVREGAEGGSGALLLVAISHWLGVSPLDMADMEVFLATPGLMRIDSTCSYTAIRLDGVLTELAHLEMPGVMRGGDVLTFPFPRWIAGILRALRALAPAARCLRELPGFPNSAAEFRHLLCDLDVPKRVTAGKLVADRAQPLMQAQAQAQAQADPILIALGTLDFSRVPKVATAYQHVTHQEVLETLTQRANLNGWGELAVSPVPPHGYLSKVTPELDSLIALGQKLLLDVQACYPGSNAGIARLLVHHKAYLRYTGFVLAAAFLLRGQQQTLIPAAVIGLDVLAGFNDKATPSAKSATPSVVVGRTLQHHLRYLRDHYLALARRLENLSSQCGPWASHCAADLRRAAAGEPHMALLLTIEDNQCRGYSHLDLVADLGDDWVAKADAIRHAAPDLLRAAGIGHASIEAFLRHVGGARPIVAEAGAWSPDDWSMEASRLQDIIFAALKIMPCGGLVQSLGRT